MLIKCIAWDVDNTLIDGNILESRVTPKPNAKILEALTELHDRGIISCIASRNPPGLSGRFHAAADWPAPFICERYGCGRKSDAIRSVAAELDVSLAAIAFVDDDPYERAEVAAAIPEVIVLGPEDFPDCLGWPEFAPTTVTEEGRRRSQLYIERRNRQTMAARFATHAEFLEYCQLRIAFGPAAEADVPRLTELAQRTHQLNSGQLNSGQLNSGQLNPDHVPPDAQAFKSLLRDPEHKVVTVRAADRFGDDGIVGGIVIRDSNIRREVPLIMMSCRAIGRGIIDVLLTWLLRDTDDARIAEVIVPCGVHASNVALRLALVSAGFTAHTKHVEGPIAHYTRSTHSPVPKFPAWAQINEEELT